MTRHALAFSCHDVAAAPSRRRLAMAGAVLALTLVAVAPATAEGKRYPGKGDIAEFKVVSQTPSAFTSRALFASLDALLPSVEACGHPIGNGAIRQVFELRLDVAADGTVSRVSLDKKLDATMTACLTKAFSAGVFEHPKRATKLMLALIYPR